MTTSITPRKPRKLSSFGIGWLLSLAASFYDNGVAFVVLIAGTLIVHQYRLSRWEESVRAAGVESPSKD